MSYFERNSLFCQKLAAENTRLLFSPYFRVSSCAWDKNLNLNCLLKHFEALIMNYLEHNFFVFFNIILLEIKTWNLWWFSSCLQSYVKFFHWDVFKKPDTLVNDLNPSQKKLIWDIALVSQINHWCIFPQSGVRLDLTVLWFGL